MKIGVLGGTFDPIHLGHLKIAEHCKNILNLNQVVFIPSGNPPHKKPVASYKCRKEMLLLALEGHKEFQLLECEKDSGSANSYTYNTLKKLQKLYSHDEIFFIIGEDNVTEIKTWYKSDKILDMAKFVVLSRNVNDSKPNNSEDQVGKLKFIQIPKIPISSKEIRKKLTQEASIKNLVPSNVFTYIMKKKNLLNKR